MKTKLVLAAATLAVVATAAPAYGCDGYETIDGCITIERYNDLYSYEKLATVPSLVDPSRSVADVYGIVDDGVEPVDRPRSFGGEELPTIREVIAGKLWAV